MESNPEPANFSDDFKKYRHNLEKECGWPVSKRGMDRALLKNLVREFMMSVGRGEKTLEEYKQRRKYLKRMELTLFWWKEMEWFIPHSAGLSPRIELFIGGT
jgi:hypothetical protein